MRLHPERPHPTAAAALLAAFLLMPSGVLAFHDQGVASCAGCHVMHDDGLSTADALLRGLSASDVCLSCHGAGAQPVFGGTPLLPPPELGAGNFVFLLEDELNDDPRPSAPSVGGHHAGHSIVAPGAGLVPDPDRPTAPGGTFPSAELGCTSCHDPHGNASFRMLNGAGPVQGGLYEFLFPAPEAEGMPLALAGAGESPTAHSAYRSGLSDWCANCHGFYHDVVGTARFEHPYEADLGGDWAQRYDEYLGEADPDGGSAATAYLPQVPFEAPGAAVDATAGPGPDARVACLTCHRAHATSAPAALRWDARVATLGQDGLASGSYPLPNPYGDPDQRQLCLKCHEADHALASPLSCVTCHATARHGGGPELDGFGF